jgi:toxin CptA
LTAAAPALRLDLKPSRLLAGVLIVVHGLAIAAAWISLSGWTWYVAGALVLASLGGCLARERSRPVSLELREEGRASWRNRTGGWHEGRLGRNHFVSVALVVLELELEGRGRKWVVLMGDSAPPDDFRRLRIWLRWRGTAAQASSE